MYGWHLEEQLNGWRTAGIDEAGRGALAGPIAAGAVILEKGRAYPYRDSKKLTPKERRRLFRHIKANAIAWAVGFASHQEVDKMGVLRATHLAASRAIGALAVPPEALVTDNLRLKFGGPVLAVTRADSQSYQVAAASIAAKVSRDELMCEAAHKYERYGFELHKGYGTPEHLLSLQQFGPCEIHRHSFHRVGWR